MKKLDDTLGRLSKLMAMLAALCTLVMMGTMIADVVSRVFRGGSLVGAYEFAALLLVMVVFLGFAYAERTETNVRVTLVTSRLPPGIARVMRLLGGLVATAVVALFARATWNQALISIDRGEFTQGIVAFPIWPAKLAIAVGFTVLTLECVLGIWRRWRAPSPAEVHPDLAAEAQL